MSFLRKIFGKKDRPIQSKEEFWNWFTQHQLAFFKTVKSQHQIEAQFLNKLSNKLDQLKEGYYFLTGMYDDDTVELIFTADGAIENIVFVEELVAAAPSLNQWRFTALKPASDIENLAINMNGYSFSKENLYFYSNDLQEYPDEIDITVVYDDFNKKDESKIINGIHLFLDNYLGELKFATNIDNLSFIGKEDAQQELIPINKLEAFLTWREAEFVEKYEGERRDTEDDEYLLIEGTLESGKELIATINQDALEWDRKASHPWVVDVTVQFNGDHLSGLPDDETFDALNDLEDEIQLLLKDEDGYLYIGRQTTDGHRNIFFACREFRTPSKVLFELQQSYASKFAIDFNIYKDKYWQSFKKFRKEEGEDD